MKNFKEVAGEINPEKLHEIITYMHLVVQYPIPNRHCVENDTLRDEICDVLYYCAQSLCFYINQISDLLSSGRNGKSIKKFFKCTRLIRENQIFNRIHIENIQSLEDIVRYKMNSICKITHEDLYTDQ